MNKLVELLYDVDGFCRVFIPEWEKQLISDGTRKRNRACRITMSQIITIIIAFYMSNHRDFKNYYKGYITKFYCSHFPNLLTLKVMPKAIIPLSSFSSTLNGESEDIEFIDSTSIKVCHNLRIPRHKKISYHSSAKKETMGWFYGLKLHLVTNFKGAIVDEKLTTANIHDTKSVLKLSTKLTGKLYTGKGYISKNYQRA